MHQPPPLSRCPECHAPVRSEHSTCGCGTDLDEARAEFARLIRPNLGRKGLPFSALKRVPRAQRGEIARLIERAQRSYDN